MKITTGRLILYLLNPEQLKLLIGDLSSLEKEINIKYRGEPVEGVFKEIMIKQLEACKKDRENYLWNSFWLLIRKEDRLVIGSIGFKGKPNTKGEVEIGYGLGKEFEHNGYMTEGVKSICNWVLDQNNVLNITAETDADNIPSQRILKRCGFKKIIEKNTIWWSL